MKKATLKIPSHDFMEKTQSLSLIERGQYITILAAMSSYGNISEETIIALVGEISEPVRSLFSVDHLKIWHHEYLEKTNSNQKKNENKKQYGVNRNILLTDEEISRLKIEFGEHKTNKAIEFLSEYGIEKPNNFREYKDHNRTLRRWVFNAVEEKELRVKNKPIIITNRP